MLITMTPDASVMMNGGIPKYATPTPLNNPIRTAMPRVSIIPISALPPIIPVTELINTAEAVTVDATERSMPPVSMTRPWPKATIAKKEPSTRMFSTWSVDGKAGLIKRESGINASTIR
jgi:hypothetical protein